MVAAIQGEMDSDLSNPFVQTRKRLTSVVAERMVTVVDTLAAKTELVFGILQNDARNKEFRSTLPKSVCEALESFRLAEADHVRAVHAGDRTAIDDTKQIVFESTMDLGRAARDHEGDIRASMLAADPLVGPHTAVLENISTLRAMLFQKLLTTADEERERQAYLSALLTQEDTAKRQIEALAKDLREFNDQRSAELQKREAVIERLTDELHHIDGLGNRVARRVDTTAKTKTDRHAKDTNEQKQALQADLAKLETQLASVLQSNRAEEGKIRKEKFKLEAEIQSWIDKYDIEMAEKQAMIDEIEGHHQKELSQMAELQKQYDTIKGEYDAIMEQRRMERERQERAAAERAMQDEAAGMIQRNWRRYREEQKALKKGGSKKKKGSGKKGKKKK